MVTDRKDGFPACDWIGADDGVDGGEFFTNVVRGAARAEVDFEVVIFRRRVEDGLGVGSS